MSVESVIFQSGGRDNIMITFLINQENKERIEVLDQDAQFVEEQKIVTTLWGKTMIVKDVILFAKTEGDKVSGFRCSIIQNVFLIPHEEEKKKLGR